MPLVWTPPPSSLPSLQPGDVCLWAIDLHKLGADYDALLSPEELARADRFLSDEKARRFRSAHGALHAILALHTERPAPLRFFHRDHGRPILDPASPIEFSLSHSCNNGLIAVTCGRPIGADIEHLRPIPQAGRIARTWFSPAETMQIAAAPAPNNLFLSYWTLKEAVVKATGEGLKRSLSSFTIGRDASGTFVIVSSDNKTDMDLSLLSFAPMPRAIGAIAVTGAINRLWCWRF